MKTASKTARNAPGRAGAVKGRSAADKAVRAPASKPALDSEPAITTEIAIMQRRTRFNPLRALTAESLARALDCFRSGDLRWAVYLWEAMAEQDDTLVSVKPKREKSTAHREWKVLIKNKADADDAEAKKHQAVLENFWRTARAVNAYDRNETGGMSRLIRQMMSAVSMRYAVHHLVWKPLPGELRAEFEFVPLYFFENRTGQLRFVRDGLGTEGEEMPPQDWMITVGDGLMIAGGIAAYLKRLASQDLMAFSERFGTPGVVGRTRSGKDTEAGRAMAEAVAQFGSEWSGVIYGDEGDAKIELIEAKASANSIPMPVIMDRMDRKMIVMWRGADLGTMSSSKGEGTGASLQTDETKILDLDDATIITETLAQVERTVIAWHFGRDVEPLAGIKIMVPEEQDMKLLLAVIVALVNLGAPFDVADVLGRFGFSLPSDKADLLKPSAGGSAKPAPALNDRPRLAREAKLREAISKDNEPSAAALKKILLAMDDNDPSKLEAVMKEVEKDFPEITTAVLGSDFATTVMAQLAGEEMREQLAGNA